MPVGSQATVKSLTPDQLLELGLEVLLSNTYHLYLRPGVEVVERLGGLHRFMGWPRAILTDSGGFQIFSLSRLRQITAEGVNFRSHIDGSPHFITPEMDVRFQEALGADIIMALDICPAFEDSPEKVREATATTLRWAERCRKAQRRPDQALFGIVQGGFDPALRAESAAGLAALDFSGYALGGLSLGEPVEMTHRIVAATAPLLPGDKPRYLMGVGSPEDILYAVEQGIDMFDSVLPTRIARNGALLTDEGRVNINNARWAEAEGPLDPACGCYTCKHFSAAYLHHLFRARELLAYSLATVHNLYYMQGFMRRLRLALQEERFSSFRDGFVANYRAPDESIRIAQKQKWLAARERDGQKKAGV
jgi:queuine tRNA-ribosyltransferase